MLKFLKLYIKKKFFILLFKKESTSIHLVSSVTTWLDTLRLFWILIIFFQLIHLDKIYMFFFQLGLISS